MGKSVLATPGSALENNGRRTLRSGGKYTWEVQLGKCTWEAHLRESRRLNGSVGISEWMSPCKHIGSHTNLRPRKSVDPLSLQVPFHLSYPLLAFVDPNCVSS